MDESDARSLFGGMTNTLSIKRRCCQYKMKHSDLDSSTADDVDVNASSSLCSRQQRRVFDHGWRRYGCYLLTLLPSLE